jgi:hypothetical protein
MSEEPMTLNDLAVALAGLPTGAIMMIETPEGPRRIRSVRCGYGHRADDRLEMLPPGGARLEDSPYLIILSTG